ncbi:MAG TPA: hypothetical protein DEP88_03920 [Verrucomicrobiales bacterium]|nr:hypothetical protein [Verrucomicrobiales bacterium]HCI90928.1 hypothetical protein [Verrucomicrobiales bacterium]HCL97556.1 hypothetical protein [Verrucomicrobiales bacterium]
MQGSNGSRFGKHNQLELGRNQTGGNDHVTDFGNVIQLDPMLPNEQKCNTAQIGSWMIPVK